MKIVLAISLLGLLALQLSSLFILPAPNSLRWYGDETWLMTEAHSQIATGVVHYPIALGSTLVESKGLVLSMTWLSSILYGLPTVLINADPIMIGRVATAVLSILLLFTLFFAARSLGASSALALISMALLAATRAFLFSSHSCRTDILAGLIVLAFVWQMLRTGTDHFFKWWFGYGALVAFLCISSSIHLLTLLGPVALYFAWKRNGLSSLRNAISLICGALMMLALLTAVYVLSTGSTTLFSPHAHQFRDVLSSIPILRPLSRSVQVSNIVIRSKEFWTEAPIAFVAIIFTVIGIWKHVLRKELAIATAIVFFSWLLLEGAEINYLIHVLPLLLLCFAVSFSQLLTMRWHTISIAIAAIVVIALLAQDTFHARSVALQIDQSNSSAIQQIVHRIASTWTRPEAPLVLSEPPSLESLTRIRQIHVMTDHFISLPEREEPIDSTLTRLHVNYAVLYNSPSFPKHREQVDSLYRVLMRRGTLIDREIGMSGDVGRQYFGHSDWQDTLILIQLK
jgi:hypothetical protein